MISLSNGGASRARRFCRKAFRSHHREQGGVQAISIFQTATSLANRPELRGCEFRGNPAGVFRLMSAAVPI